MCSRTEVSGSVAQTQEGESIGLVRVTVVLGRQQRRPIMWDRSALPSPRSRIASRHCNLQLAAGSAHSKSSVAPGKSTHGIRVTIRERQWPNTK